jgi:predicted DNA-binding protein (MmcQ/YjbR family)
MQDHSLRNDVLAFARNQWGTEPEYLWTRFPNYAVLRHPGNRKWYGLIMDVPREKLGVEGEGRADILNVKIDDEGLRYILVQQKGYLPGYHISRGGWLSVLLDGTVALDEVCERLSMSFEATAPKPRHC